MVEQEIGFGGRIIPTPRYRNAGADIDWRAQPSAFARKMVVPRERKNCSCRAHAWQRHEHVETEYGRLVATPEKGRPVTQGIYVVVDEIDAHTARAKSAGAEIVIDIKTQDDGGRDYTARDLEGHVWTFATFDPWVRVP